jgi:lysophospholipase L1-like esterase
MKEPTQQPTAGTVWSRQVLQGVLVIVALFLAARHSLGQKPLSIPEEIEWTWEVRPPHPDAKLPNVLLLGDSISRNYFPQVTKDLTGVANVYLLAVSTSLGDPRLIHQIDELTRMENVPFRVVHFNNGMHGWDYTEAQYKAAFPELLHCLQAIAGRDGGLVWATITPVKPNASNGATNPRIAERNRIALALVQTAGIAVDDQHALMMQHPDLYEDTVHFGPAGAALMGDQAAATIRAALSTTVSRR